MKTIRELYESAEEANAALEARKQRLRSMKKVPGEVTMKALAGGRKKKNKDLPRVPKKVDNSNQGAWQLGGALAGGVAGSALAGMPVVGGILGSMLGSAHAQKTVDKDNADHRKKLEAAYHQATGKSGAGLSQNALMRGIRDYRKRMKAKRG